MREPQIVQWGRRAGGGSRLTVPTYEPPRAALGRVGLEGEGEVHGLARRGGVKPHCDDKVAAWPRGPGRGLRPPPPVPWSAGRSASTVRSDGSAPSRSSGSLVGLFELVRESAARSALLPEGPSKRLMCSVPVANEIILQIAVQAIGQLTDFERWPSSPRA
jgi:hypothetical protein